MRFRSLLAGLALLTTGTVVGVTSNQFASADVTSGDRLVFVPIDTCRIADTRAGANGVGPRTSPLGAADTLRVDSQQADTECTGQIPADAVALSLNVSAVRSSANSFITVWDGSSPRPVVSALNPQPDGLVFNAVVVNLAPDNSFSIYNNAGTTDVFVDVNGYYDTHTHDDRYYTEAEVDAALTAKADTADVYDQVEVDSRLDERLRADSDLLPIAQVKILSSGGVRNSTFRAPLSGPPTSSWDGSRYVVDLPGFEFRTTGGDGGVCTANGGDPRIVTIGSIGGDLLVYVHDLAGTRVQASLTCVVFEQ